MDERTRTECAEAIDRISGHLSQLGVETELLRKKLELERLPPDDDGDGPPPASDAAAEEGESAAAFAPIRAEITLDDLGVEVRKTMGLRGYEDIGSFHLDPHTDVRFFHPGEPGERFRPVLQMRDLSHAPRLLAQIELLEGMPLLEGISIAAPGTSDAVARAVEAALPDYGERFSGSIDFIGLGEDDE
jgi:hypothetical protein